MSLSASEPVESSALAFQSIDHVEGSHGLSLGMLGVGHGIADHVLQETPEDCPGLIVDQRRDSLDASSPRQSPYRWLRDAHYHVFDGLLLMASSSSSFPTYLPRFPSFSAVYWWHSDTLFIDYNFDQFNPF